MLTGVCRFLVAVLLVTVHGASAWCADYFINDSSLTNDVYCTATGADAAGRGATAAVPYATFSFLLADRALLPGDRVFIDTGAYADSWTISDLDDGSAVSPVTIVGSPLPGGTLFTSSGALAYAFRVEGTSDAAQAAYVTIANITFDAYVSGAAFSSAALALGRANNITVANCVLQEGTLASGGGNDYPGVGIVSDHVSVVSDKITIRNCVFRDNPKCGVLIWDASTVTVQSCTFYNNGGSTAATNFPHTHRGAIEITTDGATTTLRNNIIYANSSGSACIVTHSSSAAAASLPAGFSSDYNDLYPGAGASVATRWASDDNPTATDADIAAWRLVAAGLDPAPNSFSSDPLFADAPVGDFHLKSKYGHVTFSGATPAIAMTWKRDAIDHSPCIDAGSTVVPYDTFTGESADNGARVDLGAYGNTPQASHSGTGATNDWTGKANPPVTTPNSAANTWPSGLDQRTSWNSHGNWSHGVPTSASGLFGTVKIGLTTTKNPQVDVAAVANGVSIDAGGVLDLTHATAYTLDVSTTFTNAAGTVNLANGTLTVSGTTTNLGTFLQTGGTFAALGDFTSSGGYSATSGTLRFTGAKNQTVTTVAGDAAFALAVDNSGASGDNTVSWSGGWTAATATVSSGILHLKTGSRTVTGATTVAKGRLKIADGTTTFAGAVTVGGAGVGAQLEIIGPGSTTFNAAEPALTVGALGTLITSGVGASRPTLETTGATWAMSFASGTVDVNGAIFKKLGDGGLLLGVGTTVANLNDATFSAGPGGGAVYIRIPALNTGSAYRFRYLEFTALTDATVQRNIEVVAPSTTTVRVENGFGNKGKKDSLAVPGVGGEENDLDIGESGGTVDDPAVPGQITWLYFQYIWRGGTAAAGVNDDWGVAANWEKDGVYPAPDIPDSNSADVLIGPPDVAVNGCTMEGAASRTVRNLALVTGGTLSAANTLSIWGTAFKPTGGLLSGAAGSTVEFAGPADQVVIVIGGGGALKNLRTNKSSGSAVLGASLTVDETLTVRQGIFRTSAYALTQNGNVSVSDTGVAATLVVETDGSLGMTGTAKLTVASVGTMTVKGDGLAILGNGTHSVAGKLSLENTGVIRLPDKATAILNVSGTFTATPTSTTSKPTIARVVSGAANLFAVNLTGTVRIAGLNFSNGGPKGLEIGPLASLTQLDYVSFTSGDIAAGSTHFTIVRNVAQGIWLLTSEGCTFDSTAPLVAKMTGDAGAARALTFSSWSLTGGSIDDPNPGTTGNVGDDEAAGRDLAFARVVAWNGKWKFRRTITVLNPAGGSALALPNGAGVELTIDHAALVAAGKSLASGDDLRIVYDTGAGDAVELDRVVSRPGAANTAIHFATRAALGDGASSALYYLYYGASTANAAGAPSATAGAGLLTFENWESGLGSWTAEGPWTVNSSSPYDRAFHADHIDAGGSTINNITSAVISTMGKVGLRPRWAWRYTNGGGASDTLAFQWSTNAFVAANAIASLTATTAYTNTKLAGILPTTAQDSGTFQVRWRFTRNRASDVCSTDILRISINNIADDATVTIAAAETGITTLWSEPMNWTAGGGSVRPRVAAGDDVVIDGDFEGAPVLNVAGQTVRSVRIGQTAPSTLNMSGANSLTITNSLLVYASGTVDSTGDTGTIAIGRDLTVLGTLVAPAGTTTVTLNGSGTADQAVSGAGAGAKAFSTLTVVRSSNTGVVAFSLDAQVNTALTVTKGILSLSPTAVVRMADGAKLTVTTGAPDEGTLKAVSGATVTSTTVLTARYLFKIDGGVDVDGLTVRSTGVTGATADLGLELTASATIVKFRNVTFRDHSLVAGDRFLTVTKPSGLYAFTGCFFEGVGAGRNVALVDSDIATASTVVKLILEGNTAATANGPGAGEGLVVSFDVDNDNAPQDGVSDIAPDGAVIQWAHAAKPDLGPTDPTRKDMFPQAAFDLTTGSVYAIYVAYKDAIGGTDVIYVLDTDGKSKGYWFEIPSSAGDLVGIPWWDQKDLDGLGPLGVERVLFAGTTLGYIYMWIDPGTGSGAITEQKSGRVNENEALTLPLNAITSPLIADASKLYFGGNSSDAALPDPDHKMYGLLIADATPFVTAGASGWTTASSVKVLAAPSWRSVAGVSQVVMGTEFADPDGIGPLPAKAYIWRIAGDGTSPISNDGPKAAVSSPTFMFKSRVFAGDEEGKVHKVNSDSPTMAYFSADWPAGGPPAPGPAYAITGAPYYDYKVRVYWGDESGRVCALEDVTAAVTAGFPVTPGGTSAIHSSPILLAPYLYVGNTNGKIFKIDVGAPATILMTYDVGDGVNVGDLSYSFDNDKIMVGTGDGRFYMFDP